LILNKDSIGFWSSVDSLSYKIARYVIKIFFKNKFVNIQTTTIIALVSTIILRIAGNIIVNLLFKSLQGFPF
jgi:hypothetical protein